MISTEWMIRSKVTEMARKIQSDFFLIIGANVSL